MATQINEEKAPTAQEDHKLDRIAEEAAVKSSKTEKKYDRDHDIFTK